MTKGQAINYLYSSTTMIIYMPHAENLRVEVF